MSVQHRIQHSQVAPYLLPSQTRPACRSPGGRRCAAAASSRSPAACLERFCQRTPCELVASAPVTRRWGMGRLGPTTWAGGAGARRWHRWDREAGAPCSPVGPTWPARPCQKRCWLHAAQLTQSVVFLNVKERQQYMVQSTPDGRRLTVRRFWNTITVTAEHGRILNGHSVHRCTALGLSYVRKAAPNVKVSAQKQRTPVPESC